jgi:hypothetical protein
MKMRQPRRAIDVFGVARDGRDAAVDRLADLSDYHEIIDRAVPQRTKPLFPWLRQRAIGGAEFAWNRGPLSGVTARVIRLVYVGHVFVLGFANKGTTLMFKTMICDD